MDETRFDAFIDSSYATAVGEGDWATAMTALSDWVGSAGATLLVAIGPALRVLRIAHGRLPAEMEEVYFRQGYEACDPRRLPALRLQEGDMFADSDIYAEAEMSRMAYYEDFLGAFGLRYGLCGLPRRDASGTVFVGLQFARGAERPGEEERRRLRRALPHLRRAVGVERLLGETVRRARGLADALDRLAMPVLLLRDDAAVLHANAAAVSALADSPRLRLRSAPDGAERLRFASAAAASAFAAALADCAAGGCPAPLRLRGAVPLQLLLAPLPRAERDASGAVAMLALYRPAAEAEPPAEVLRRSYGLTAREAALLEAAGPAFDLPALALREGVATKALRRRFAAAGRKLGSARRAELLQLATLLGAGEQPE